MLLGSGRVEQALTFVDGLVDRLEQHVVASENNLTEGIDKLPMHGIIAAVR